MIGGTLFELSIESQFLVVGYPGGHPPAVQISRNVAVKTTLARGSRSQWSRPLMSLRTLYLVNRCPFAMLIMLEILSPDERAVFVLREVFDCPYTEIAQATAKSLAAVRQLASRAKARVRARQPRFELNARRRQAVSDQFLAAVLGGDI